MSRDFNGTTDPINLGSPTALDDIGGTPGSRTIAVPSAPDPGSLGRTMARELVPPVRANATIDWAVRENVRAHLRVLVKRILRRYSYPPDRQEKATHTVLEQAAVLWGEWAIARGPGGTARRPAPWVEKGGPVSRPSSIRG